MKVTSTSSPNPIQSILVPVDFSECSRKATLLAVGLAEKSGAHVHLLHSWRLPVYVAPELEVHIADRGNRTLTQTGREYAQAEMEEFVRQLQEEVPEGVTLTTEVVVDDPRRAIVRLANEDTYDLIVMGRHGRSLWKRLVIGTVAERVVREAPCPVLTVPVLPDEDED